MSTKNSNVEYVIPDYLSFREFCRKNLAKHGYACFKLLDRGCDIVVNIRNAWLWLVLQAAGDTLKLPFAIAKVYLNGFDIREEHVSSVKPVFEEMVKQYKEYVQQYFDKYEKYGVKDSEGVFEQSYLNSAKRNISDSYYYKTIKYVD